MRQIGARQEAARLGGIGVCGRELCCSTWLTDFRSVSTNNIRYQQLSVNPSKLAGQCGKLKCCLNYELDAYLDALKEFPEVQDKVLVTQKGQAKFIKIDVFRRRIYWAYENDLGTFIPLSIERTKDILEMNKNNVLPEDLLEPSEVEAKKEVEKELTPVTTESNLDRFNDKFKKNKKNFQNRKNK